MKKSCECTRIFAIWLFHMTCIVHLMTCIVHLEKVYFSFFSLLPGVMSTFSPSDKDVKLNLAGDLKEWTWFKIYVFTKTLIWRRR